MDLLGHYFLILCTIPWTWGTWTPSIATWILLGPDNETCVLLTGQFQFTVPYLRDDGQVHEAEIQVPIYGQENGTCTKWKQNISISWTTPSGVSKHLIVFSFSQNGTSIDNTVNSGFFQLVEIQATLQSNPIQFPGSSDPDRIYNFKSSGLTLWTAPLELSYFCDTENKIPLGHGSFLTVSHLQVQPFHQTPLGGDPTDFAFRSYCGADIHKMMSDGLTFIALLFFVSIVIVLFLQWHRRAPYKPLN